MKISAEIDPRPSLTVAGSQFYEVSRYGSLDVEKQKYSLFYRIEFK
jgi:hypothetical protein